MDKALGLNGEENMGDEFTMEKPKHKSNRGDRSSKGEGRRDRASSGQEDKSDNDRVTLFIKNISFSATEEDLEDHFPGATEVRWPSNHDGSKKGFAFIQFANEEDVDKAISELQGTELCGRALMLDYVGSKSKGGASGGDRGGGRGRNGGGRDRDGGGRDGGGRDGGGRDRDRDRDRDDRGGRGGNAEAGRTRTLIVKNLSWNTDEDLLRDEFEGATSARIVMRDGKSAGFGFVDFEDEESCSNAYRNMHDAEIDGRSIKVDFAAERGSGGGGGGGRGGGRGGGGMRGGRGGRGSFGGRGGRSGFGGRGGRDGGGGGRGRGGGRGGGRREGGGREYSRKSYD